MGRTLFVSLGALLISSFVFIAPALATPYGSGSYGDCSYQTNCSTPTPTPSNPPVAPAPEPAPATPTVTINTPGLEDNQLITRSPFTIVVDIEPVPPSDTETPSLETGWVSFYIDDKLLGSTYNPSEDGMYRYEWNVREDQGKTITITVYNKNGEIIARKDIPVRIALPPLPTTVVDEEQIASTEEGPGLGAIGRLIHQTPPFVAQSFPYWFFIILIILAIRLVWQTVRETIGNNTMQTLLTKQRLISDEKDNFIALSSHYLHTPLTVIRSGADTMLATGEANQLMLSPLLGALDKLKAQIDMILNQVENSDVLGNIKPPSESVYTTSTLRSPFFWMPVVAVGAICLIANILFGFVGQINLGFDNLVVQVVMFVVAAAFFFFSFRTHRLRVREHDKSKQLVDYQNAIDTARNAFIRQSTDALSKGLEEVSVATASLKESPTKHYIDEGYNRFDDILTKFSLLAQLQTGADATGIDTFPLKTALDGALAAYQEQIAAKKLQVHTNTHNITVTQNPQLFSYVLKTIIDNAIKFSNEGGEISITASKASGQLEISVIDNGIGIPADKLPSLFKPFSRATSAIQFDYEGLGFSLFLDKIIMDYLDGDIAATSAHNAGTTVTVTA